MRSLPRPLAAIGAGLLLSVAVAGPALAHAELVSSDPADKAVLPASTITITLTFSEDLDASKSSFKLLGPGGEIGTGKVGGVTTQMLLPGVSLAAGDYTVQWTSVATDQDLLRGTLKFTVSGSTATATATVPSVAPTTVPSPSTSPDAVQPASGDVLLPIVAALVLVAGAAFYLVRRGRRA